MSDFVPLIVGLGGTTRVGSSSEIALRYALRAAERAGAQTAILAGPALNLPMYAPENPQRSPSASELISLLRRSHGVIVASPGYHGSISGLVKNALDYVEDMRSDSAAYFDGRAWAAWPVLTVGRPRGVRWRHCVPSFMRCVGGLHPWVSHSIAAKRCLVRTEPVWMPVLQNN